MSAEVDESSIRVGNYVLCLNLKHYSDIAEKISTFLNCPDLIKYNVSKGQTYAIFKLSRTVPYVYTLFKNGHVNVTGIRRVSEFKDLVQALLSRLHLAVEVEEVLSNAKIQNISATAKIRLKRGECVNLRQLYENTRHPTYAAILDHTRFNVDRFPACNIKIKDYGSLLVFSSGKVVIVGCKNVENIRRLVLDILPNFMNNNSFGVLLQTGRQ